MLTREALQARQNTIEGTRPTGVTMPGPGVYWVRRVNIGLYFIDEEGQVETRAENLNKWAVYSWDHAKTTDWYLIEVAPLERGRVHLYTLGSDESEDWDDSGSVITHVSAEVKPPPKFSGKMD